jgi:hypothetical protein
MRLKKSELRKIIKEEVARALHEQHYARGNRAPSPDSNWSDFAVALDIGVLDLDEMAYDLGFSNFHDMDQSITPAVLAERDPQRFAAAAQGSSSRAMDMNEEEILAAAGTTARIKDYGPEGGWHFGITGPG